MVRSRRRALALWGVAPLVVGVVVGVVVVVSSPSPPAQAHRAPGATGGPVTDWLAQMADDRAAAPSPTDAGTGVPASSPAPTSGSTSAPGPDDVPPPSPPPQATESSGAPDADPRDVAPPAPVPAAPECLAVASVLQKWPGGYQSEVTVTAGSDALDGWLVTWAVPDGHTVGGSWGAAVTIVDGAASAASASWAAHVDAGRSLTFGMMGSAESEPVVPEMQCFRAR